jgi:hypothetical protein
MNADEILRLRDRAYGGAWAKTGKLLNVVINDFHNMVELFPEAAYNWVIILNKLVRALASPREIDHWIDMRNYAQLVVEYIEGSKEVDGQTVAPSNTTTDTRS